MPYSVSETYGDRAQAVVRFPVMPNDVYGDDDDRANRFEELQDLKAQRWVVWAN